MADSSGGTTYQYNQLSQLTSETRTFSGLAGSYTLAYGYHVGGQLKSLTDHTNQRINYAYDNAGRVSALTGTNYTYGQFINTITYRAWGAPGRINYGNGSAESVTYNSRLKATHYQILKGGGFGTAASIDYQYYDDGRLKYSHDLLDNRFDRSYEYDHVGRLTKALSGAEARGEPATSNRPYKETATYDPFDHLNVRSSKHWSRPTGFGSSDTYSNNRRTGWTYDADGNWLSGAGRQQTYDAAGRTSTTTWTGGYFNEFSDGDGHRVKTVEPNLVTYYLRSTVLGGQVIEELNSSGVKQKAMLYGGQKVIGYDWANGNVSILHEDPSGLRVNSSVPQSPFVGSFVELDPWGAEVFAWDPYLEDPQFSGGRGEGGPIYPGFGDISMPSSGCTLDGALSLCDAITRGMMGGAIALQLRDGGKTKQFPNEISLLGIFAVWVEDAGKKLTTPQTPLKTDLSADEVIVTNTDDDGLGHFELVSVESQNSFKNQSADCSIEVNFGGRISRGTPTFDTEPDHEALGKTTATMKVGKENWTAYEFRFEVRGSVNYGRIGHIGSTRDLNNGGQWTIGQWAYAWPDNNKNGFFPKSNGTTFDDSPKYLKGDPDTPTPTVAVNRRSFSWIDSPGFLAPPDDPLVSAKFTTNFIVYALNGKRGCAVEFHIRASFSNGRWQAVIGQGLLH